MEKYRLVRMNEVKYTDNDEALELLLDEGFLLEEIEPETEPTDGEDGVGDKTQKQSRQTAKQRARKLQSPVRNNHECQRGV